MLIIIVVVPGAARKVVLSCKGIDLFLCLKGFIVHSISYVRLNNHIERTRKIKNYKNKLTQMLIKFVG